MLANAFESTQGVAIVCPRTKTLRFCDQFYDRMMGAPCQGKLVDVRRLPPCDLKRRSLTIVLCVAGFRVH
jgi:hypothetical protein